MGYGVFGRLSGLVRTVLSREKLDELPAVAVDRSRPSLFWVLTAREVLPRDVPATTGKDGFLSWLLRPESLPLDPPVPSSDRDSFLGKLLSRERLPEDQAPGPRPGRSGGIRT